MMVVIMRIMAILVAKKRKIRLRNVIVFRLRSMPHSYYMKNNRKSIVYKKHYKKCSNIPTFFSETPPID
jgi:hypothetical protein